MLPPLWKSQLVLLLTVAGLLPPTSAAGQHAAAGKYRPDAALAPLLTAPKTTDNQVRREAIALRAYLRRPDLPAAARFLALNRLRYDAEHLGLADSVRALLTPVLNAAAHCWRELPLETALVADACGEQWYVRQQLDSARQCFARGAAWLASAPLDFRGRVRVPVADSTLAAGGSIPGAALGHLYGNWGLTYLAQDNYPAAVPILNRGLAVYERAADRPGQSWLLALLAALSAQQQQLGRAGRYLEQAVALARHEPDPSFFSRAVGTILAFQRRYERVDSAQLLRLVREGLTRLQPMLAARPADRDLLATTISLHRIAAEVLLDRGDVRPTAAALAQLLPRLHAVTTPALRQALLYYPARATELVVRARLLPPAARPPLLRRAVVFTDSMPDARARLSYRLDLANDCSRLGCDAVAVELLEPLARQKPPLHDVERSVLYHSLRRAYANLGQWQEALQAGIQAEAAKDSLHAQQYQRVLAAADAQHHTRESEQRVEQLTQEARLQALRTAQERTRSRWLVGALLGLLAALGIFGWLYARLRRSQRALAAATRTKDRLYAIIGHDLRGPLTSFSALASIIDIYRKRADYDALGELTDEVAQTAQRLTALLDNLLYWAANQSGELAYVPESVPAADLLTETADLYRGAAQARGVTLRVAVQNAGLALLADRNMTRTILRNLVHNALKVVPPATELLLAAEPSGPDAVTLLVRDQGPGLPAERLRALLAPAAAGATSARTPEGGTGLGLPLVQQLTRRQGGTFGLESTPSVGTVARVTLPRAATTAPEAVTKRSASSPDMA